jgi:ATP-dependent DNA helicase RecG
MPYTEVELLEYKRELTDNLKKEIIAFLNADCRKIHFGVCADGTIAGEPYLDALQLQMNIRRIGTDNAGIWRY